MSVMMNITVYGMIVYKCSDNRDFCQDFDPKTSPPQKNFLGLAGKCDICYNYGHKKPPIVGAVVIFANPVNLEGNNNE